VPFFAEFGSNKLASIDPATMTIHEYTLPNPESRPRRIAITPDDAIWYTDYAGGHLGRFDPKTGNASEWPSPGGVNSGPYGITVVKDVLWYSESGVSPNTSCGSIRRRRSFKLGRSLRGEAWCAI